MLRGVLIQIHGLTGLQSNIVDLHLGSVLLPVNCRVIQNGLSDYLLRRS